MQRSGASATRWMVAPDDRFGLVLDLAEAHYLAALQIGPDFTPARAHRSQFYNQTGRSADAERVIRVGLKRQPAIGELQYSLGLLRAVRAQSGRR